MKITILTLFPEYFDSVLNTSIIKKAQENNLVEFQLINIRDFAQDKHQTTDDRPFGGGPGMVMKIEPIDLALKSLVLSKGTKNKQIILTSAKGRKFDQDLAKSYASLDELVLVCGHYEGVDERVAQNLIDEEVRIGDYVLTGGEPAVAVMLDAVSRLIPGVLGNQESNQGESQDTPGQMGFPSYTRPADYLGLSVPEVLLSGDHEKIDQWREEQKS